MTAWELEGKVSLVTGGNEGIGLATVEELLKFGSKVIMVSRSEDKLLKAALSLGSPDKLTTISADLFSETGRERVLGRIQQLGRLDILVNNVGYAERGLFSEMEMTKGREQFEMNFFSCLELTQHLYPFLKASRGSVINVSSVAGGRTLPQRLWYGSTKAALDHATKSLANEWGPEGIRVNAVSPWFTVTSMTSKVLSDPKLLDGILKVTPLKRLTSPQDVAQAITFLAMPASSYITGVILQVDGGFSIQGGLG